MQKQKKRGGKNRPAFLISLRSTEGAAAFFRHDRDVTADALEVPVNLIVEKADHLQALAFKVSLPPRVMAAAGVRDMTVAIKLNDQPGRGAVEVNDIIADGALPPEADRAGAEEVVPEVLLLRRHRPAESTGLLAELGAV